MQHPRLPAPNIDAEGWSLLGLFFGHTNDHGFGYFLPALWANMKFRTFVVQDHEPTPWSPTGICGRRRFIAPIYVTIHHHAHRESPALRHLSRRGSYRPAAILPILQLVAHVSYKVLAQRFRDFLRRFEDRGVGHQFSLLCGS